MKSNSLSKALLLAAGLWLGTVAGVHAAPLELDRIVAVVNNDVITDFQLRQRVEKTLRQLARQNVPAPSRRLLERQLLERMITEKVLLQLAEETNIRIDGAQLDRAIARIAAQNGMDTAAFRNALAAEGVNFEAFRTQVREELTLTRLREREVDNRLVISEAEVDNYLANPALAASQQTEYNLAHILVVTPEAADPQRLAELKDRTEKALAELKAGADFAQVSAAYSDAQNALQGGSLGWRGESKLPALFADAVRDLQPGQVSPVLRSANGFHIVKLLDKRGLNTTLVVQQTRARHILIKTNEVVNDQEARKRLLDLRDRIRNGEAFAKLARMHSDDLSASRGGDLGWINPGDTVPPFERAMDALQPGDVSEPVNSPFGWHLIQVQERREQDVTQERRRLEARKAIRDRKSEEAFDDWVRQMRDRAYVEYRTEE